MAEKYHMVSFKVKGPAPAQKPAKPKKKVKKKRNTDRGYPNFKW